MFLGKPGASPPQLEVMLQAALVGHGHTVKTGPDHGCENVTCNIPSAQDNCSEEQSRKGQGARGGVYCLGSGDQESRFKEGKSKSSPDQRVVEGTGFLGEERRKITDYLIMNE